MEANRENKNEEVKGNGHNLTQFDISETTLPGFGERHKQCLIMFLSLVVAYSMRACMGVALVAMSDPRADEEGQITNATVYAASNDSVSNTSVILNTTNHQGETEGFETHGILNALLLVPPYPTFWWNHRLQDTIQSSFFYGYMSLQIPGGWLAHRYGGRRLLVTALACNAFMSFVLPWAACYGGWIFICVCRMLQGLSQACIIPSLHTLLGKWAPLHERSRMVGFVYGGQAFGTVIALPLTGFVAASPAGWPGTFRLYALLAAGSAVAAALILADSPRQHPKISAEELEYIEHGLQNNEDGKRMSVPYRAILTSTAFYAISIAHISQTYGQLTLFAELPTYMARVMGVNLKANGLLTALPFMAMWIANFFFNWLMDFIIVKEWLSVTHTRKLANSLGTFLPALGLVALAYAPRDLVAVEAILIFICSFKVASMVGYWTNNVDLSPNFAGTIASLSNFASNLVGCQAPLVAGFLVTDPTDARQWRWVFFVCAGLYTASNCIYLWLGSAVRAEWDAPPVTLETQDGHPDKTTSPSEETKPMLHTPPPNWKNTGTRPSIASINSLPGENILY